jgi:hypothetical protein
VQGRSSRLSPPAARQPDPTWIKLFITGATTSHFLKNYKPRPSHHLTRTTESGEKFRLVVSGQGSGACDQLSAASSRLSTFDSRLPTSPKSTGKVLSAYCPLPSARSIPGLSKLGSNPQARTCGFAACCAERLCLSSGGCRKQTLSSPAGRLSLPAGGEEEVAAQGKLRDRRIPAVKERRSFPLGERNDKGPSPRRRAQDDSGEGASWAGKAEPFRKAAWQSHSEHSTRALIWTAVAPYCF